MGLVAPWLIAAAVLAAAIVVVVAFLALCFRVVVPTNAVHIVQSGRRTTSFGKDMGGNTYYKWPSWVPHFGVRVSILPLSVFRVELESYAAYDKGRLPFVLDVLAFFRISDPSKAAERLSSIAELDGQLQGIMQGVVRTILANSEIEDILGKRAEFSDAFTKEVATQLPQWGVETVKNIELMDIRDGAESHVIEQIMAKKKSFIEMESRVAVATNTKTAQTAEIDNQREVAIRNQEAQETIGVRTAQKDRTIGISVQQSQQAVKQEAKNTATAEMAIQEVQQVRTAEIQRGVQLVAADQEKQTAIIKADGERQRTVIQADAQKQQRVISAEGIKVETITVAEGNLESATLSAKGVEAQGLAKGAAEQAVLMAPVNAQITLAKEIGGNEGYQTYLIRVKDIEAGQAVGIAQADAMKVADIKIIANAGTPGDGIKSVGDLFTSRGGLAVGAALEGLGNTETGAAVLKTITGDKK
jgi:flotillin